MSDLERRIASLTPEQRKLLEQRILQQRKEKAEKPTGILPRGVEGPVELSFAQRRLWFLHQFEPNDVVNHIPMVLKLKGHLDTSELERSISVLVSRHEALRTTFSEVDGEPIQSVEPASDIRLTLVEASEKDALETARSIAQEPFDFSSGTPIRFSLLQLNTEESWLLVVVHHIIADGWSLNIIQNELVQAYSRDEKALPVLPVQYPDFARWQRNSGETFSPQLDYWREKLANPPVLDLPTDLPRKPQFTYKGNRTKAYIPIELIHSLESLAKENGATLFMVLLAALNIILSRYSAQKDIVVGSPVAGRSRSEIENLVGVFINTMILRNDLSGQPTFREFLSRVRETTLGAFSNQDIPIERLIEDLKPERDLSRSPFFQVMLVLQNHTSAKDKLGELSIERDFIATHTAMHDLSFYIHPKDDHYAVTLEYCDDLFHSSTIDRFLAQFLVVLEGIVAAPDTNIDRLPVLPQNERETILQRWNETAISYDRQHAVYQLISEQAKKTPLAIAVQFEDSSCTYEELETRSNQLAHHLRSIGIHRGSAVGLFLNRSIEMVVGLLGIMKAGACYIPLDPAFPIDRLAYMVKDANIALLLSDSSLADEIPGLGAAQALLLDTEKDSISQHPEQSITQTDDVEDLAYVIYTSGSTGLPKGVEIQHLALVNFLHSMSKEPGIEAGDRLLAVTTLSFDIAALEIYLPLISGACVILASREEAMDARKLATLIAASQATIMQATPATWRMLIDTGWSGDKKLKLLCGGEALSSELAKQLQSRSNQLWNLYGPTETTIWSMVKRIQTQDKEPILIGRPIANTKAYLLDGYLQPLPIGVPGELLIGGEGLARGYLDREELTAERFIANPFSDGERLYRTGDIARYRADGQLEVLGRIDHQVKVRGFRIELGEIESVLSSHPIIEQVVVDAQLDNTGENRLVAYYISQGDSIAAAELREYLKQSLPDYMLPSIFIKLDALPLTPNGKIDKKALPSPSGASAELTQIYVAPENSVQTQLCSIWADVLDIERVGIRDNFFDLGGHSILALRLVSKIESETGINLPLIDLFQGKTIEDIASSKNDKTDLPDYLVGIRKTGSLNPFFAVGSHPRYNDAANQVDKDRPFYKLDVYALQSRRLAQGKSPYKNIDALVDEFIDSIQKIQPSGPYYLGGGCEGALLAFALATELQRRGEEVKTLILWITPAPGYGNGAVFGRSAIYRVINQLRALLGHAQLADLNLRTLSELVKHEYLEYRIFRAMDTYQTNATFSGEIVLARCVENRKAWDTDLALGWGERATSGARVHKLSGNHDTWLIDHTEAFGDFLNSCL